MYSKITWRFIKRECWIPHPLNLWSSRHVKIEFLTSFQVVLILLDHTWKTTLQCLPLKKFEVGWRRSQRRQVQSRKNQKNEKEKRNTKWVNVWRAVRLHFQQSTLYGNDVFISLRLALGTKIDSPLNVICILRLMTPHIYPEGMERFIGYMRRSHNEKDQSWLPSWSKNGLGKDYGRTLAYRFMVIRGGLGWRSPPV